MKCQITQFYDRVRLKTWKKKDLANYSRQTNWEYWNYLDRMIDNS